MKTIPHFHISNPFLRMAVIFGLLLSVYLSIGVAAYLVPDAPVRRHVEQTLRSGDLAEDYPKAVIRYNNDSQDQYTLDNFTDALILNQAMLLRNEGLKTILLLPRYQEDLHQSINLHRLMEGPNDGGRIIHYARYWHGNTFVARLLLSLTSYTGIRYLLYLLSSLLGLWCLLRLWRTADPATALSIAAALLLVNAYVMQFSLQFAPVLLLSLGGIVWITHHPTSNGFVLFFVLGSLTAFLDLITVPSLTLGLPLVTLVAVRHDVNVRRGLRRVIHVSLWWLTGYTLTWVAKWGLATLLTGENIFADAYGQGSMWSEDGFSYLGDALASNLGLLHWKYVVVAVAILAVTALVRPYKGAWRIAVQYLPVAAVPFVYYLLMAHPAQHHAWFNYRALATTVAALLTATASMVDWHKYNMLWKEMRNAKR